MNWRCRQSLLRCRRVDGLRCLHHGIICGPATIGGNISLIGCAAIVVGAGRISGWVRGGQKDSPIRSSDAPLKVETSNVIAPVGIVKSRETRGMTAAVSRYTCG